MIALKGLSRRSHLLTLDNYVGDAAVDEFLSEVTHRLDRIRVLRVGMNVGGSSNDASVTVDSFDLQETSALLTRHGVRAGPDLVARVHAHGEGRPAVIREAAADADFEKVRYTGVLSGCDHGGDIEEPGDAYKTFAKETGQRPPFLSFVHSRSGSC